MPIPITPKRGVYSVGEFAEELEKRLDESYGNPEIFGGHSVDRLTDGAGTVTGFSMSTVQKGNASLAAQDRKAIMSGLRDTGVGLQYWAGLRSITDGAPQQRQLRLRLLLRVPPPRVPSKDIAH